MRLNGGEFGELSVAMEDSLMMLFSLMTNRYNAPFSNLPCKSGSAIIFRTHLNLSRSG